MKTLMMTVGLPRSGKSTWARRQKLPIVSPDAIRISLHGERFIKTAEAIVWAHAKLMVASLFEAGHDTVILDATNTIQRYRDEWLDDRWQCQYVAFTAPMELCIKRAERLGQDYLIPVIERMAANFELPENIWLPEDIGRS